MPHAQPWVAALFDICLRAAKPEDQKIAQPLFCACQIVCRIHRPQHIVARNLPVKGIRQAFESGLPDRRVNMLLFHCFNSNESIAAR